MLITAFSLKILNPNPSRFQFEASYNFRFEDPNGDTIVTHARKA